MDPMPIPLLRALVADPTDLTPWGMLADWHEEQGHWAAEAFKCAFEAVTRWQESGETFKPSKYSIFYSWDDYSRENTVAACSRAGCDGIWIKQQGRPNSFHCCRWWSQTGSYWQTPMIYEWE